MLTGAPAATVVQPPDLDGEGRASPLAGDGEVLDPAVARRPLGELRRDNRVNLALTTRRVEALPAIALPLQHRSHDPAQGAVIGIAHPMSVTRKTP